jgi:hypothetical protein
MEAAITKAGRQTEITITKKGSSDSLLRAANMTVMSGIKPAAIKSNTVMTYSPIGFAILL